MVKFVVWGGLDSERIPENERDCYLWVQGGPPTSKNWIYNSYN